jgi:hypothetical protein
MPQDLAALGSRRDKLARREEWKMECIVSQESRRRSSRIKEFRIFLRVIYMADDKRQTAGDRRKKANALSSKIKALSEKNGTGN